MADNASRKQPRSQRTAAPKHAKHAAAPQRQRASSSWRSKDPAQAAASQSSYQKTEKNFSAADLANNSDVDSLEQVAPRPVLDPAATGSFQRINPSQGAVVTDRHNVEETSEFSVEAIQRAEHVRLHGARRPQVRTHETKVKISRPLTIVLGVIAALVIIAGVRLVLGALSSTNEANQEEAVEQTQVAIDGSIDYHGTIYSLQQQEDGSYALMGQASDQGTATAYFSLSGTPVQLVLYNGALLIPENLSDGSWDVIAYTMGAGGMPTQVVDADGNAIVGEGEITSVELQDPNLLVSDSTGATTEVSLA